MAKIAVLGHGVVGSGVVEVVHDNQQSIVSRAGEAIEVKRILDLREFPDLPYSDRFTKDFSEIVSDPEISVVAEVMGGVHPAYEFSMQALRAGKSVVTSNKELVAQKGAELLAVAQENGVKYLFEASVGGGIPIIRPLHQCLAANELTEIVGILNGTTNFILTKMFKEGMEFREALAEAQRLGYAERDPSADIEGGDACRKICILASLAFGKHVYPDQVETQGITKITAADVAYAGSWGGVIKLIGRAKKREDGKLTATVGPAFIKSDSQLAGIEDVFNGILVRGNAIGDVVFYGRGAGKLPTASAVVADIIDAVKNPGPSKSLHWEDAAENQVADWREDEAAYYICLRAADNEQARTAATGLFGEVQALSREDKPDDEFAFVTVPMSESKILDGAARLAEQGMPALSMIRVLDC